MYQKALSIYYSLVMFAVGAAVFTMYPSSVPEMTVWQNDIKYQLNTAFVQTFGDSPWFSEVGFIYESISNFYEQSSMAAIALLTQPQTDEDVYFVFGEVYSIFAKAVNRSNLGKTTAYNDLPLPPLPVNFMSEEPLYNIIPYRTVVKTVETGKVAGSTIENGTPINSPNQPWVTLSDNLTGQIYCLAIYNGTINKYLGPCKYDDYY